MLLSVAEFAQAAGITVYTVYLRVKLGRLVPDRKRPMMFEAGLVEGQRGVKRGRPRKVNPI